MTQPVHELQRKTIDNPELQLAAMLYIEVGRINRTRRRYATLDELKDIPAGLNIEMDRDKLKEFIYSLPVCYFISPSVKPDSYYIHGYYGYITPTADR